MPKSTEDVKNELTGLQYSIDQIQLSKINIDLLFISNTPFTKELIENTESYFESREKSQQEWERKVTEAAGLEYDESKPFDRQKIYEILGDEMNKISKVEDSASGEIESLLGHLQEVKKLDDHINEQLDEYLNLFEPNQQSDFHFMLDALQNFVEWADDYSAKIKTFKSGRSSDKLQEEFRISSEFVSLCCNWLSATVSTVLKYGFEDAMSGNV